MVYTLLLREMLGRGYLYSGLGHLVGQAMTVKKNAYGYTGVSGLTGIYTFEDFMAEYGTEAADYVAGIINTVNSSQQ